MAGHHQKKCLSLRNEGQRHRKGGVYNRSTSYLTVCTNMSAGGRDTDRNCKTWSQYVAPPPTTPTEDINFQYYARKYSWNPLPGSFPREMETILFSFDADTNVSYYRTSNPWRGFHFCHPTPYKARYITPKNLARWRIECPTMKTYP